MMKTVGSIESFTGGLFAATITKRVGASKYYKGTVVSYQNEIKEKLGIDTSGGVVNSTVAKSMALHGKKFLNVDLCISFTGVAGPDKLEGQPVGLAFIAFNDQVYKQKFTGTRTQIQKQAVDFAIKKMDKMLNLSTLKR